MKNTRSRKTSLKKFIAALFLMYCSCSDHGHEILKKKYPPEVFEGLFVSAKAALMDEMKSNGRGGFREINYGSDDAGVFVRLINNGNERGCIGFIRGVSSMDEAVKTAVIDAAFFDKRYKKPGREELPFIEIEITIIDRLVKIGDYLDFKPGIHTIYIKYLNKSAVMQGQIALERRYSREDFLRAICIKGGIPERRYREKDAEIYRANTVYMRKKFADINTGR
ncbi:MAG: AMMECR1 family protein [Spirochaetes bacterium]|jgi:uncharacterized protein (TIGR00296 family)|nr:AMMECR1 family protein [Spirochaetota bacterium]